MKTLNPKTQFSVPFPPAGATPVTEDQLLALGITPDALQSGEWRGKLKSYGPWQLPVSFVGLAETSRWDKSKGYTITASQSFFGVRTLTNVRQSGYQLEGRVSVNGKSYRGFTSSQLFELPDGKLVNVATIFVCMN